MTSSLNSMNMALRALGRKLCRFASERRGVAAVEFAIIAPLLLSLYLVTMEVGQGIEINKKVGRVGSMVADLVTQQQTISRSELNAILSIGEAILQPYNRSRPTIVITAIQITDENNPRTQVVWSRKIQDGVTAVGPARNSLTTVPDQLKIRNTFLIRVESQLAYEPVITYTVEQKGALGLAAAFDGIGMNEVYYLRPRMSPTIPCGDC